MVLHPFGEDIWLADGPVVDAVAGFHYPTRMAVIRLSDGGLLLWSPVTLTEDLAAAVDGLGAVAHVVAPNHLHHAFLDAWRARYPDARFHAAPGLASKRPDIGFDRELSEEADLSLNGQLDQVVMAGNAITTEVVFFHRASGTVLFADLLQQFPKGWFRGWRGVVARLDLMCGVEPMVPRKFRLAFRDRPALRGAVDRVLEWPVRRVVMAHGEPVQSGAHDFLQRAFGWV